MSLITRQIEATKQGGGDFPGAGACVCPPGLRNQRGLTLVELVMAMIIVGVLAVAVAPRFSDTNVFQSRGAADQVRAALRYGQKVAIAQHRNVSVTISAAASSNCGVALAAGNVSCVISNNVTVAPALPRTVTFDALGRPVPNAADSVTVGATAITVEAETGYVHSP